MLPSLTCHEHIISQIYVELCLVDQMCRHACLQASPTLSVDVFPGVAGTCAAGAEHHHADKQCSQPVLPFQDVCWISRASGVQQNPPALVSVHVCGAMTMVPCLWWHIRGAMSVVSYPWCLVCSVISVVPCQ